MTTNLLFIDALATLHVIDSLAEHKIGIKQARILLVMHLTGADSASKLKTKTLLDSDHIRGVLCQLRTKEMLEQVTDGPFPTYRIAPKAHAFLNQIIR